MTHDTEFRYEVYCSITGTLTNHSDVRSAAAAFYHAAAADRPCVIRSKGRTASTIARTVRIGDQIAKSLPVETDPDFTQTYLEMQR